MVQFTHKNIYTVPRYINPETNVHTAKNREQSKQNMKRQLYKSGYNLRNRTSKAIINAALRNERLGPKQLQRQDAKRNLLENLNNNMNNAQYGGRRKTRRHRRK